MFGSFEEFWSALNRLYQSTVAMQERQDRTDEQLAGLTEHLAGLTEHLTGLTDRVDRLASTVARLAGTVAELNVVAERHERRLERLEGQ